MTDRLEDIQHRLNQITPGSWHKHATDDAYFMNALYISTEPSDGSHDGMQGMGLQDEQVDHESVIAITLLQAPRIADAPKFEANTNFIAHAPEDLRWCVRRIEDLKNAISRLLKYDSDPHRPIDDWVDAWIQAQDAIDSLGKHDV